VIAAMEASSEACDVADYADLFRLHFAASQVQGAVTQQRRPVRRDRYNIVKRGGIGELATQFALSAKVRRENADLSMFYRFLVSLSSKLQCFSLCCVCVYVFAILFCCHDCIYLTTLRVIFILWFILFPPYLTSRSLART
jgi:hypothetical protein